jgi:hypothetical protein
MPASPLIVEQDKARTRQTLADLLAGAKRLPSSIAGMPSDVAAQVGNLGKAAVGYVGGQTGLLSPDQLPALDERPVLGSEWMAQQAGLPERSGRPAESVGELAAGLLGPGVATAGVKAATHGAEALARQLAPQAGRMAEKYVQGMGMQPAAAPPAMAAPPLAKAKIPYGEQVDPQYRVAETAFQRMLKSDPDIAAKYAVIPDAQGGRVISADAAKKLMPEFASNPGEHSVAAHEGASQVAKHLYAQRLKMKPEPGASRQVFLTAGGAGAGKTSALRAAEKMGGTPHTIYDSNMGSMASSVAKIEAALKAGLDPHIVYTYRDPVEATVNGVIKRALNPNSPDFGRIMPAEVIAQTHAGSRDVMEQIAAKYADNPRVQMLAYANTGKAGEPSLVPLSSLPKLDYNETYGKIRQAIEAERAAGRLPEREYRALGAGGESGGQGLRAGASPGAERPAAREVDPATRERYASALGYDPVKMREQYPAVGQPVMATDPKSGKQYLEKQLTSEEESVQAMRKAAQAEINKGNYRPYFDVSQRYHANPEEFPVQGQTITDEFPKMEKTATRLREHYQTPEAYARLLDAYKRAEGDPLAHDWYATGQYADALKAHMGPEAGAARYVDDFTRPMAATTGGADPTANFLTAGYGNFAKERGLPFGENAFDYPHPVGGRFVSGNMRMYNKHIVNGEPFTAEGTPKRFNFDANFRGYQDRATMDEQMSGGIKPGMKAPPTGHYGITEEMVHQLANQLSQTPANAQGVIWAGLKDAKGMPMMEHINQAIERTAWVTGLSREEALKQIMNRGPVYGLGGVAAGGALMPQGDETVR